MARLRRDTHTAYSESAALRLRAAWLYYNQGLTQKDVAEKIGVSRTTVIRMLDEALKRSEVQIWINEGVADCVELAVRLEKAYGLDEAVVVPAAESAEANARGVGLALGQFLTEAIPDDCTIGVGWGRTLHWSVRALRRRDVADLTVVALLGGIGRGSEINMYETASRVSGGPEKEAVIRAALTGGYANHLITDERTAAALAI